MELETMYSDLLKSNKIHHNQATTFVDLLLKYVPCLNRKIANKRFSIFFDTAATGLNTSSETYFDSLVKLIGPVRKAIHRKCQKHSSLNVDLQSQLDLVPIELGQLINFLQDVADFNDKGYSKEAPAMSQTIMFNFRYNIKNKEISSYK